MQKILFCFFVCGLLTKSISANYISTDTIKHSHSLGINYRLGSILPHYAEMEVLKDKNAFAFEISYLLKGSTNKLWHIFYRNPQSGITYKFMDLGNREILGFAHTLYPFIKIPLIRNTEKFNLGLSVGSGLAYITKKFDAESNQQNLAISTNLNAFVDIGLVFEYRLIGGFNLTSGIHLSHFSNGTFMKPNYGLNYSLFSLGLNHTVKESVRNDVGFYNFSNKKNRLALLGLGSIKEIKGIGGPKYGVGAFSVEYSRKLLELWRYGFSFDLMYDKSHDKILELEQIEWTSNIELLKSGITFNTEFIFDRLSAVFYFGGYTYNKAMHTNKEYVYQRLGLRYRCTNNLWLHLALKTHWNVADYIEFGVAVKII
jgi:hypothetical protein